MISVIIPTYQRYEWLQEAVCSVLQQTYKDVEIIVIDDCSDDSTAQIVHLAPNIKYLRNDKNRGPGYSRRRGFLCSRGEYIVFLDDDDYYIDSNFFLRSIELMGINPDYSFVAANAHTLHMDTGTIEESKLNIVGEISSADYLEGFPFKNRKPCSTFTTVFRKASLVAAGIDQMEMVNDMPIYMRCLLTSGKVYIMEQAIGIYRIHSSNISKRISPDFLIENLEEKKKVFLQIKKTQLFPTYNYWWLRQIDGTLSYYVYGSCPDFISYNKVKRWCMNAAEEKAAVRRQCRKYTKYLYMEKGYRLKKKIKTFFGIS